jgi:thioredoxin 1
MNENMNMNATITEVAFEEEVLKSKQPVLAEFWTPWSRPCQILHSVLQELACELAGKVKVVTINADASIDLSLLYDIKSIPTLLYFVEGIPRLRIVGTATKDAILAKLKPLGVVNETVVSAKGLTNDGRQPGKEN